MRRWKLLWIIGMLSALTILSLSGCSGNQGSDSPDSGSKNTSAVSDVENGAEGVEEVWTPAFPNVKELDLSDQSVESLSSLVDYPNLETLNLTNMDLSTLENVGEDYDPSMINPEKDVSPLENILACNNLKSLDLHGTKVSYEIIDALREYLPDCELRYTINIHGKDHENTETSLTFATFQPKDHYLLTYFDDLQDVDMSEMISSLDSMQDLASLCPNTNFKFKFKLTELGLDDMICDYNTTFLDLNNIEITDMDALRGYLAFLPNLEQLEMCDSGPSNEEMAALRDDFPDVKVVWMIHMSYHDVRTDVVAYSTLSSEYESRKIQTEEAQQLMYCTDLLALDLGHQNIEDISFLNYLPNIRVLILADNNIKDLSPIANLTHLRHLEIFMNYYAESLEPLRDLTELECVNICFLWSAKPFDVFYNMPNLQKLWITGTSYTYAEYNELRDNVPEGCKINIGINSLESTGDGWRLGPAYEAIFNMFRGNYCDPMFLE